MKLSETSNKIIYVLYLINLIMYASSLTYFKIEKRIFIVNLFLLTIAILFSFFRNYSHSLLISRNSLTVIQFLIVFLLYIVITFPFRKSLEGVFPFIYSLLFCFLIINVRLNEKFIRKMYIAILIVFIMWMLRIHNYYDYFMVSYYDLKNVNTLNSNLVGMIIMLLTVLLCAFAERIGIRKFVQVAICILGIWGTWNASTRGALIALLFFFIANFCVPRKMFKNQSIMQFILAMVFIVGMVFPIIYTYIGKIGVESEAFLNGKNLFTGRELIWNEFFDIIRFDIKRLFFGIGELKGANSVYLSVDGNNMHNWFLKMIFSFGITGLILYYMFIVANINNIYKKKVSNVQITLLLGYFTILINSFFENMISSYVLVCLVYLILALANNSVMGSFSTLNAPTIRVKRRRTLIRLRKRSIQLQNENYSLNKSFMKGENL